MIALVIIGLLASIAIPAFKKVRETSQINATKNTLRQYAQAADQYLLEYGVTSVNANSLVGNDKYIKLSENKPLAHTSLTNGGLITQGNDIVITGLVTGDVSIEF
jgi:type IV pilus assembly protein PilA